MTFSRHLEARIETALRRFPVVLMTGARQVGKTTLARAMIDARWPAKYLTLDDRATLDAALLDPDGFLEATPPPAVLDEIQRAPDLMRAIKKRVDERRRPGMFLLTGSADVLTLKSVSERLTGRVAVFSLEPFSWTELRRSAPSGVLETLFRARTAPAALRALTGVPGGNRRGEIQDLILRGGYPVPALMKSARDRRDWFSGYRSTYLDRDVRDLAALEHLPEFNRLLALLALRTGQLANFSDLSRDCGLAMMTLRRYLALLEATFQIHFLPPYHVNLTKRLVKTPKLYLSDAGLACFLSGADSWSIAERQGRVGALVETWAACELRRRLALLSPRIGVHFWRVHEGHEVDFVLEGPSGAVLGIEVKWSAGIGERDLSGLRRMRDALGPRMGLGVLAHMGAEILGIDAHTVAVPLAALLGPDGSSIS